MYFIYKITGTDTKRGIIIVNSDNEKKALEKAVIALMEKHPTRTPDISLEMELDVNKADFIIIT